MRQNRDNKRDGLGITAMVASMDSSWEGSRSEKQEKTHGVAYVSAFSSKI